MNPLRLSPVLLLVIAPLILSGCGREETPPHHAPVIDLRPSPTPVVAGTSFFDVPSTPVPTLAEAPTPLSDGDCAVARVGGTFVMLSEILKATAKREIGLTVPPGRSADEARIELRRNVLDQLIERKLTEWEANLGAVALSPEEQKAGLARMIDGLGGYQAFRAWAEAAGVTEEALRRRLTTQIAVDRLFRRNVLDRIDVSEETMRAYFDANRTRRFRVPACIYLRRVLVAADASRDRQAALALAEDLRGEAVAALDAVDATYAARIEAATDSGDVAKLMRAKRQARADVFRDMALAHSDGPARRQGGYIALYDVLLDGTRDMAFDLRFVQHVYDQGELDTVSEIVEVDSGYTFYLVTRKEPSKQKAYEESKDLIQRILQKEQRESLYRAWIERLDERAGVEVYPRCLAHVDEDAIRAIASSRDELDASLMQLSRSLRAAEER